MAFSNAEIAIVKGMIARGDKQSDIAAYFGVNGGRISEVNTGKHGPEIASAAQADLPAPGPYFASGRSTIRATETLTALRDLIDQTLDEMKKYADVSKEGGGG